MNYLPGYFYNIEKKNKNFEAFKGTGTEN